MSEKLEFDLREISRGLLKRAWIIVLSAVVLGAAYLFYTISFVTPLYQARVTMYVNNNYETQSDALTSSDLAVALRLVNSYVEIIGHDVVLDEVAAALPNRGLSAGSLSGMVSAQVVGETEIFTVTVTSADPQLSADVANTIARVAPDIIAEIIPGSRATLIDAAKVPGGRCSPSYTSSAIVGMFAGGMLATIAILIYMHFDVHVKNESTLESICKAPVMGVIPDFAETIKRPSKKVRR